MRELELKLELDGPIDADALGLGPPARVARLDATYFDAPDGRLAAAGGSLRIRRDGDAATQTLKLGGVAGGAGLFDRVEWEGAATGERPDPAVFGPAFLAGMPVDLPWDDLRPVHAAAVERALWRVTRGESVIEAVLDVGAVRAGAAQAPVAEVELELKDGAPADLFDLARELTARAPLRLGVLTKAERGERLASGALGRVAKADPPALAAGMTTGEALAAIVAAGLRHYRLNEPLAAARDAEGLHQARVALRRLRSAFSLFGRLLDDDAATPLRARLKALAAVLGEARDLDVLIGRLDEAPSALRDAREAAYDRVAAALDAADARALPIELAEWAATGGWRAAAAMRAPAEATAAVLLERWRKRLKARSRGLKRLSVDARHEARIEAKKLRYAADFFAPLFDAGKPRRRRRAFTAALADLQESLGALNDIATAAAMAPRLDALGVALPPAREDVEALLRDARDARRRLFRAKRYW